MLRNLSVLLYALAALVLLDIGAAVTLRWADGAGRLGGLVRYFEYGRSVPGKLERWVDRPEEPGNLFDVAWIGEIVEQSAADFAAEDPAVPRVRTYGMSFVNNVMRAAQRVRPDLVVDAHAGPSAPPNFTYAVFLEDRANRRPGDVAVLGILSQAVPAMATLGNRSWVFEQPAPFTYPIFRPDGAEGLARVDPLMRSAAQQRRALADPAASPGWAAQQRREDLFHSPVTSGAAWLDLSPFARLVRRSAAKRHFDATQAEILDGAFPYAETLRRMATRFAAQARADGQHPVVMLIQGRDPRDPDLAAILRDTLEGAGIPVLATVDHFDPRDLRGFAGDGHYRQAVDDVFGQAFVDLLDAEGWRP